MASFDPDYCETEVSEEERECLTPEVLKVLGEPALKAAGEKLEALLSLTADEVDAAIEDFKQLRRGGTKS